MEECKRCLLHDVAEEDTLKSIKERIDKLPEQEKAGKELYSKRLNECKNCDNLISGVCMKCGCYVEFRAAFKKQNCPNTKDRKW
ncbi:MAG: hypothetical protein IKC01_00510 [Clostridia bacterium]|nr:hypothetical protein [Clostridia bacterium]